MPSTLSTEVVAGRVRIHWYAPGDRAIATSVHRRTLGSDWTLLGHPSPDLDHNVVFEDDTVLPGIRYGYRLVVRDLTGAEASAETWVTVPEQAGGPGALRLEPAYPNPSGGRGQLSFALPRTGRVRLTLYDLEGRHVATVMDRVETTGWHSVGWDGNDRAGRPAASGTYFARLETAGSVRVQKLVLLR